jgi:biopolymer transport protein ExbB
LLSLSLTAAQAGQADLDALVSELKRERQAERHHHREREARFLAERDARAELVAQARAEKAEAEHRAEAQRARHAEQEARILSLQDRLGQSAGELSELFATARQVAADTRARLTDSMVSAELPRLSAPLDELAAGERLPGSADLETLWLVMLEDMAESGRVARFEAPVIFPGGEEARRLVVRVGPFTAIGDGRYLRYLPEAQRFVELERQPPLRHQRLAVAFEQATEGVHPVALDPSRGALLGLVVRSPTLVERIQQGGVVGYLILGLGALALLMVFERYLVLAWVQTRIRRQRRSRAPRADNPLGRISLVAERYGKATFEALDLHLDESVSRESARLTRGLATLAVFAAVAPLLGLLGTVTGMIETFQTITLFGAGDPKLMSSGISEALVTTQLGLVVAIPVLLLHSFLRGRANRLIGVLDEHSTGLLGASAATES